MHEIDTWVMVSLGSVCCAHQSLKISNELFIRQTHISGCNYHSALNGMAVNDGRYEWCSLSPKTTPSPRPSGLRKWECMAKPINPASCGTITSQWVAVCHVWNWTIKVSWLINGYCNAEHQRWLFMQISNTEHQHLCLLQSEKKTETESRKPCCAYFSSLFFQDWDIAGGLTAS